MAQTQVFRGTARAILRDDEGTNYIYHRTAVVKRYYDGRIKLNSGGWNTRTTLTAMNQASNQDDLGFRVYQKAFKWFVDWKGQTLPFNDGIILD